MSKINDAGKPILTEAALRRAANDGSYRRGRDYHRRGLVTSLLREGDCLVAKVRGTRSYKVRLWSEDGEAVGECSCPMGDAGEFCKHLVAVGLTHLEGEPLADLEEEDPARTARRGKGRAKPKVTLDDVREYLRRQEPARLVELIMQQVEEDDRLRETLLMEVAGRRPGGIDLATFRAAIDEATDPGDFVDYRGAWDYTLRIQGVLDSIAELIACGHATEVIGLAEQAIERCEAALGRMDDSDGGMGSIFERLQELHHAACLEARPDPAALARRLFQWEIETSWETFQGAAEAYADVLGEKGLAVYRKLAQKLWDQMPQLGPGDKGRSEHSRYRVTTIMESLALASGDVEQLVAVMARDLSSPYCYLEIAEVYKKHGLNDKALEWAEKGLAAFAEKDHDSRLEDFVADEYHRRRRHDEAMAVIWRQFRRGMHLGGYRHLKEHADRAGQWPAWREKALAEIRKDLDRRKREQAGKKRGDVWRWAWPVVDGSLLVEVFLWEDDPQAAWQEAQPLGCNNGLWMRLAATREKDHPADALAIYQKQIDPMVDRKNNDAYREAALLLRKIRELMGRLGQDAEYAAFLATVRKTHKPKRNFMAMIDDL